MKRFTEIFWWPLEHDEVRFPWVKILTAEPKHFYPLLKAQREGSPYLKCPSIAESCKNSFVICCPYDLVLTFDKQNKNITTDRYGQAFYDRFIVNRSARSDYKEEHPMVFSILINYLFFSHDDTEIEVRDVPLLTSESTKNIKMIPGRFNISKWFRPIEFAAEVIDDTQPVVLKAGDPLFMVTFITKNGVPVKMTRRFDSPEIKATMVAFTSLKMMRPGLNLKECYAVGESLIGAMKRWLIK